VVIDREACAAGLDRVIQMLSAPPFSSAADAVTRYAFTDPYLRTVDYVGERLRALGFDVSLDPVGNLVARNCPPGIRAVGLGSHCDSVRGGGSYDGLLGVLVAIEVARGNEQLGLGLPLQIVSFVEEEASGFGQMLLGSRIASGQIDPGRLREDIRALDDGRSFYEHAREAGLHPEAADGAASTLADLGAWIEVHIEQGRVLDDAGEPLGIVEAIAGYVHADVEITGQADHAGATPMGDRHDAAIIAAELVIELERLAREAGGGAVATVGELTLEPGIINIIPGRARVSLDIRAPEQSAIDAIFERAWQRAQELAAGRGLSVRYSERQRVAPMSLDQGVIDALAQAAAGRELGWRRMISGAAHDTMCVASRVPSAMVFVPCRAGISHSPAEHASTADAAVAVEVVLDAATMLGRQL
jgi:hydantoinase/carbamoylase family amidase